MEHDRTCRISSIQVQWSLKFTYQPLLHSYQRWSFIRRTLDEENEGNNYLDPASKALIRRVFVGFRWS